MKLPIVDRFVAGKRMKHKSIMFLSINIPFFIIVSDKFHAEFQMSNISCSLFLLVAKAED